MKPLHVANKILRMQAGEIALADIRKEKTQRIIENMLDFVYGTNNKGTNRNKNKPMTIGLSANQVGILKKISIVDLAMRRSLHSDIHVIINPKIIKHSKAVLLRREGCVNLPNIWGMVPRYKTVTVQYADRWGNEVVMKAKGWVAVLMQHEIDHLHGTLFIDRLPDPKKAHFVKDNQLTIYKKQYRTWETFIDVKKSTKQE